MVFLRQDIEVALKKQLAEIKSDYNICHYYVLCLLCNKQYK